MIIFGSFERYNIYGFEITNLKPIEIVDGIYNDGNGHYYFSDDGINFSPVNKVDIDFSDYSTVTAVLEIEEIHDKIKEDVLNDYMSNRDNESHIQTGTLYYASTVVEKRTVNGYSMRCQIYTTSGD